MLEPEEREYVYRFACIPEQVPEYVSSVSGAEPFLQKDHLCYVHGATLVFIGYPLAGVDENLLGPPPEGIGPQGANPQAGKDRLQMRVSERECRHEWLLRAAARRDRLDHWRCAGSPTGIR